MTDISQASPSASPFPAVRAVDFDRPWVWLQRGWDDMWRTPAVSLAGGALFAIGGMVLAAIAYFLGSAFLVLPLAAGFMLIGPIAAVGAYDVSRRLQTGEPISFGSTIRAFTRNPNQIGMLTGLLLLVFLLWVRSAMLIFMLFFSYAPPGLDRIVDAAFFSEDSVAFLIVGNGIGAIIATFIFSISVVSVPMLLDRKDCNIFVAIITSVRSALANPKAMLVWASLIALFIFAGVGTFFLGLIITLPLIGHATWHAYKDIVAES